LVSSEQRRPSDEPNTEIFTYPRPMTVYEPRDSDLRSLSVGSATSPNLKRAVSKHEKIVKVGKKVLIKSMSWFKIDAHGSKKDGIGTISAPLLSYSTSEYSTDVTQNSVDIAIGNYLFNRHRCDYLTNGAPITDPKPVRQDTQLDESVEREMSRARKSEGLSESQSGSLSDSLGMDSTTDISDLIDKYLEGEQFIYNGPAQQVAVSRRAVVSMSAKYFDADGNEISEKTFGKMRRMDIS
jgi:hypothetical protein